MPLHDTEVADSAGHSVDRPQQLHWTLRFPPLRRIVAPALARVPPRWRLPLATYLACQVVLLFWWIAFYPGLLTYDSVTYVLHVTVGPWVDNHSVLYEALVWLSLHITGGLAALSLGQTAAMSGALAYSVGSFRRIGVPGRWTAIAALIVAALPPIASFTIYIWKDVPFAICSYLVVPTLVHLVSLGRTSALAKRDRRVNWLVAALGLELFGVCMFRLNGFLVAIVAGGLIIILVPGIRIRLTTIVVAAIFLTFALNLYVYSTLGIQKTPAYLALAPVYSDIAVAYREDPGIFTAADKQLMAEVVPLAQWRETANCYSSDWTSLSPHFIERSVNLSGQLVSLVERLFKRAPNLILGATICRGSIAWSIFPGPVQLAGETIKYPPPTSFRVHDGYRLQHNPYRAALKPRLLSWKAYSVASFLWRSSFTPQLDWLLWRGAFWCYLSFLTAYLLARARRDWRLLSLAAMTFAQQLAILAENHVQAFRYMVSVIPIGIMLVPILLARRRVHDRGNEESQRLRAN
jgi:hypothetical protein